MLCLKELEYYGTYQYYSRLEVGDCKVQEHHSHLLVDYRIQLARKYGICLNLQGLDKHDESLAN